MDDVRHSDERLMCAVADGRRGPLTVLLRRYANPLLTFLYRMCGDYHRSEEMFQEVFLAVWTYRRRYEYPRPFRPWLFGIAANKCRAEERRRGGSGGTAETPQPEAVEAAVAAGPAPEAAAIATETAALVQQAVGRLPTRQRTVAVLRTWNGMSYAEIAEALDSSVPTVRSNMYHALQAIRRYLEPRMRQS